MPTAIGQSGIIPLEITSQVQLSNLSNKPQHPPLRRTPPHSFDRKEAKHSSFSSIRSAMEALTSGRRDSRDTYNTTPSRHSSSNSSSTLGGPRYSTIVPAHLPLTIRTVPHDSCQSSIDLDRHGSRASTDAPASDASSQRSSSRYSIDSVKLVDIPPRRPRRPEPLDTPPWFIPTAKSHGSLDAHFRDVSPRWSLEDEHNHRSNISRKRAQRRYPPHLHSHQHAVRSFSAIHRPADSYVPLTPATAPVSSHSLSSLRHRFDADNLPDASTSSHSSKLNQSHLLDLPSTPTTVIPTVPTLPPRSASRYWRASGPITSDLTSSLPCPLSFTPDGRLKYTPIRLPSFVGSFDASLNPRQITRLVFWYLYYDLIEPPRDAESWYAKIPEVEMRGWIGMGRELNKVPDADLPGLRGIARNTGADLAHLRAILKRVGSRSSMRATETLALVTKGRDKGVPESLVSLGIREKLERDRKLLDSVVVVGDRCGEYWPFMRLVLKTRAKEYLKFAVGPMEAAAGVRKGLGRKRREGMVEGRGSGVDGKESWGVLASYARMTVVRAVPGWWYEENEEEKSNLV